MTLSKSRLLSFRQCTLKLWNEVHRRDLARPPDALQQVIFDQGTRIGQLARQRYASGRLIESEYWDTKNALQQTFDALNDPSTTSIYEAAFFADNTLVRTDILKRVEPSEWEMWEVKSVGSPKEIHVLDVAIQTEIARRWAKASGHPFTLVRSGVLHLNKDYVYPGGDYDLNELFNERFKGFLREAWGSSAKWLDRPPIDYDESFWQLGRLGCTDRHSMEFNNDCPHRSKCSIGDMCPRGTVKIGKEGVRIDIP